MDEAVSYLRNQLSRLDAGKITAFKWSECNVNPDDGSGAFAVMAWFDNDAVPSDFTKGA